MTESTPDPSQSPVGDRSDVPVPRLGTPAGETSEQAVAAERKAVGDGPDVGGLTPADDAQ